MSKRDIEAIYQLSPMQQGMLFHSLYEPDSGMYVEQMNCTLGGQLDVIAFERAWQHMIERHAIFRTGFVWQGLDKMVQVVKRQVELPFVQEDWRTLSAAEQKEQLAAYLEADRTRSFSLNKAPLLRLALLRTEEAAYQFVFTNHHLLLDGWSVPLLFREVFVCYERLAKGQPPQLERVRPYRDFIGWLQQQNVTDAETFWRSRLKGFSAATPLGITTKEQTSHKGYETYTAHLSAELTAALQALARQHQITLNTLMQGVWALLLHRYSGADDVVFGATVSGRPPEIEGVERMIGLFINTLPIRVQVESRRPIIEWLKGLQIQQSEARQFEHAALVQIQSWSEIPPTQSLFESLLVFENYPTEQTLQALPGGLKVENLSFHEQTNYPLTIAIAPEQEMLVKIVYDGQQFEAGTITRLVGHLQTLLEGIRANPEQQIEQLPLLTETEWQQLLEWNNTAAPFPDEKCVHQLFETQALLAPDAVAVSFAGETLTYRELNQRANQLAHYLQQHGVGPEILVGLCVERSIEMVVGILGILKAGGAYVPLDPHYPAQRLSHMLEDSQLPLLLTHSDLLTSLPAHQAQIICLDTAWPEIAKENRGTPDCLAHAGNLAYVIYTSGSTGKPKGTLLEHRGLCNFAIAYAQAMGIGAGSRYLQFASSSFDASVAEVFIALVSGATLCLARREDLDAGEAMTRFLCAEGITAGILPPSVLRLLNPEKLPALQSLMSAGEACTADIVKKWAPGRRFFNGYGPTEATVGPLIYECSSDASLHDIVPIGRPIANLQVWILDAQLRPVAVGVPGEVYLSGVGLARGYLNRPELTAEKFIAWKPKAGSQKSDASTTAIRLYRTGDRARYLPDGRLEFLGRIDEQVKIRGFRIELGEIEVALLQHPAVREAVVIANEEKLDEKRLVAYVVSQPENEIDVAALQRYLRESLPEYMVPASFVPLEQLPLTPNGKVDRKALPSLEANLVRAEGYVAPRTPVEELLCGIWGNVLGLEQVGIQDNFFELGGHSLLATQAISKVRDVCGVEMPLKSLFEAPTIAAFAFTLEDARQTAGERTNPPPISASALRNGVLPLSFAQQRLWFYDQFEPGSPLYNLPGAVRLTGKLDLLALEESVNEVIKRHEILRTTFTVNNNQPAQIVVPELIISIPLIDLSHSPSAEREVQWHEHARAEALAVFDLSRGPLLRVKLLRLSDEEHIVLLTLHHIIADGWSLNIFVGEVVASYQAIVLQQESSLAAPQIQYGDYAIWQREWLSQEELGRQLGYWRKQLSGDNHVLNLPTDRPRPSVQTYHGTHFPFSLPSALTAQLKALSRREGATLFMTLLAAFQVLLHRYTGQQDINVGTPIANRTRSESETLIGFFVNTLVLKNQVRAEDTFRALLSQVRETALGAYAHQDVPFEQLVEALQPERDLSHSPLFQVMFILQNTPKAKLELPALTLDPIEIESNTARFDLTFELTETEGQLSGTVEYNTDLFAATTIERMVGHWETLLAGIVANPTERLGSLPLLTAGEVQQLAAWNETTAPYPDQYGFHQVFAARAQAHPESLAVQFSAQTLSYRALNERANQLAHYLRKQGVQAETLVGLCVERSVDMIVAILGIHKAGGAYLPLDPTYPSERLAFMLADAGVTRLLTQSHLIPRLPAQSAPPLVLETIAARVAQESTTAPESGVQAEHLAYVIYTSGSTGQPKGTLLAHRGLCNLAAAQQQLLGVGEGKRVLQFSSLSFDASVWEMVMALGSGATLVLAPPEELSAPETLHQLLQRARITHVTLPPTMLSVLSAEQLPELETVIAAGEACPQALVEKWGRGRRFYNAYGPTETTVCATIKGCEAEAVSAPTIGRALPNFQLYVLDAQQQAVPIGVPGELYVGGPGVARGYWERAELTAARFVRVPGVAERVYRTGDQVRWQANGEVEYLGRLDEQVKLRGFRIELGEIEAALRQRPDLQEAVVVINEDSQGDKRLVAYVVSANEALDVAELKQYLRTRLPEYMLPALFVALDEIPLSPNGKVNKRALPAPDGVMIGLVNEYIAPRTETEKQVSELWAELLHVPRVGMTDNFFDLGGHSLLATQMMTRLRETTQVELPLRTLFEVPTIAGLAAKIEEAHQAGKSEAARIAELLTQMEELTEEQVQAMLV